MTRSRRGSGSEDRKEGDDGDRGPAHPGGMCRIP